MTAPTFGRWGTPPLEGPPFPSKPVSKHTPPAKKTPICLVYKDWSKSLFGKGEVEPIGVLWHTRRTCLRALSLVRTLRKPKKLARKNGSREVVRRVKGAHSAPPSPTLLLTKQALKHM